MGFPLEHFLLVKIWVRGYNKKIVSCRVSGFKILFCEEVNK